MANGLAGLAPDGAEDYTALAAKDGAMQEVAQGEQADNAQVPAGASSVSVHGSAGTSVSLAAPSLGTTTRGGSIILPKCTKHALNAYYATDHLGTVRAVYDTSTGTTQTFAYEPFGVEIARTDECDNTHRFTGHERDTETGNDYMHFRFFSASMGRFQKPDSNFDNPGANPQGWNLYSYVKGNPVNFNDPTGHMPDNPDRPVKPVRPYGMMGGLLMGVNDSVGDQVRQAISTAEATVSTLIKNNGIAGSITVSAEFLQRPESGAGIWGHNTDIPKLWSHHCFRKYCQVLKLLFVCNKMRSGGKMKENIPDLTFS